MGDLSRDRLIGLIQSALSASDLIGIYNSVGDERSGYDEPRNNHDEPCRLQTELAAFARDEQCHDPDRPAASIVDVTLI